ncbi:MAG TPA: 4-hydroxy-tetrahydrodipicolinate reductase [Ferruginibacter sp.]|nr:4-hydroxy-tetrahydrodipicolinate reductase [Ferruginibacter sp.]
MKIALIGYGKMGRTIEEVALQRGHTAGLKIDIENIDSFTKENLGRCDVAIEFTGPHSAKENILKCLDAGIPVVSGSTGWLDGWAEVENSCKQKNGAIVYASNFSVGVNIFFEVNKKLAQLMATHDDYDISMEEIHHTQKKDAPSGTAITLAEQVLNEVPRKTRWVNGSSKDPAELVIISKREDPAPGTHSIKYSSPIDDIEIVHTAHTRKGFALGAVLAAEYLHNKKGIFSMKEVLGL